MPIAAIWFVYRASETLNYFDVSWFRRFALAACILVSFSPLCLIYMLVYLGNRFLVSKWAPEDLREKQKEILRRLILAHVAGESIQKEDRDFLEEYAWATLGSLWRRA